MEETNTIWKQNFSTLRFQVAEEQSYHNSERTWIMEFCELKLLTYIKHDKTLINWLSCGMFAPEPNGNASLVIIWSWSQVLSSPESPITHSDQILVIESRHIFIFQRFIQSSRAKLWKEIRDEIEWDSYYKPFIHICASWKLYCLYKKSFMFHISWLIFMKFYINFPHQDIQKLKVGHWELTIYQKWLLMKLTPPISLILE